MRNLLKGTADRERTRNLEKLKSGSCIISQHKEGCISPCDKAGAKIINLIRSAQWVDNNKILGNLIHEMSEEYSKHEITDHEIINPKIKIQNPRAIFGDMFRNLSAFSDKRSSNDQFECEDESEIYDATTPLNLYEREGFVDE